MATAHRLSRARWAMPVGGVLAGVLIALAVPRHAASTTRFLVSPARSEASGLTFVTDTALGDTACGVALDYAERRSARVSCRQLITKEGVRELRIEAPNSAKVAALDRAVLARMSAVVPTLRPFPLPGPVLGKPTGAKTAPLWLGWLGLGMAVFLPAVPLRQTVRRWTEEGWASPLP